MWEKYYKTGALATCPTATDGGYDLEVKRAWVEFFSTLPDGARILDIGTGNGIVASIAAECAAARRFAWEIHASDLARIDPMAHVADGARRFSAVTFHPGTANEQLPFSDGYFDAVSGSYSLEYGDRAKTLAELFRVLRPQGDAQFLVHSVDSVLADAARTALREADLVLMQTKIYRRVHRLVSMDRYNAVTTQRAGDDVRVAIRELKQALGPARQAGGGRVLAVALDAVQKLLTGRTKADPQWVAHEVDRAESDMRASVRRMSDLIEHAQSVEDMTMLEAQAKRCGFTLIEHMPQYHGGSHLVGWLLLLHRP